MQQFKDKDWLRVIAGHERPINSVFQIKSCLTRYKLSDVELWQPKEGEYVIYSTTNFMEDSFTVVKVVEIIGDTIFTKNGSSISINVCEPFIGKLPSHLRK